MKVLRTILTLHRNYKPYSFFGIISAILMVLATVFFIPVLITYIQTGLVPNFPTLIVCGFAVIAALLSFFTGLQLQSAVQKNKQDFELSRIRVHWQYKKLMKKKEEQKDDSYSKLV